MSTQLSGDMMWDKSSTRRFAPPGGQTSISLGDYVKPSPGGAPPANGAAPPATPGAPSPAAVTAPVSSTAMQSVVSAAGLRVGIAVCESAALKVATVNGLQRLGAKTTVYEVSDPMQLPFAAQCMVDNANVAVVVAIGFLVADAHWCSQEVAGALVRTLLELSLSMKIPVVNGLCFSYVSEGDLSSLSGKLARAAINMAAMREGGKDSYSVSRANPAVPSSPFGATARGLALASRRKASVFKQPRSVPHDLTSLLLGLRTSLKAHGAKGIFGLARRFRLSDNDRSGSISFHEFQVCMRDAHMDWIEDELKNVFEHFDTDGSKTINYDEFIFAVRGEVSEPRAQVILEAFESMDRDKSGAINSRDIKGTYSASKHPAVINKRRTEEDVLEEFISTFEGEVKDGKVTAEEWCRYYAMLSASMDNDDEFVLMMRNAWHLGGGEGGLENTTARRVLATRADGSHTIEEVKGAAGMGRADKKAMLESLRSQGLSVTAVELFGCVDATEPPVNSSMDVADMMEALSVGEANAANSTYAPPIRQGPGGNSSLVLG